MTDLNEQVKLISFHPDDSWQHVIISNLSKCQECKTKPCLTLCPSGVFKWSYVPSDPVLVLYKQCVECGACRLVCPENNIEFLFPNGGYGVLFHEG